MKDENSNTVNKSSFFSSLLKKNKLPNFSSEYYKELGELYKTNGKEALDNKLAAHRLNDYQYANVCMEIAKQLGKNEKDLISELALFSWHADPKIYRLKWLIFRIEESGNYAKSAYYLELLPKDIKLSESEKIRIDKIISNSKRSEIFKEITNDEHYLNSQNCPELLDTCRLQEDELKRAYIDLRDLYLREDKFKIENEKLKTELAKYTNNEIIDE